MDEGICSKLNVKPGSCGGDSGGDGGGGGGGLAGKGNCSSKLCGRWNPTGEQVKVLTELFRSGLRTPSSDQIQKISQQLSFYGKIETKNVFYWFQNHKARERQKQRRKHLVQHFILPPNSNYFADHHQSTTSKSSTMELEPERMMKTLQLFPINSINDEIIIEGDDINGGNNQYEDSTTFTYKIDTKMDHPPLLDLRLSFM